ncbi:MAG: ATP-binding protein [Polyangiaceae bacterium]
MKLGDSDDRPDLAAALHEVSNALTVVVGWLELARARASNHDAAAAIEVARTHAELGRRLARAALGAEAAGDPERDAADLAWSVARAVEPQASGKGVRVKVHAPQSEELLLPNPSAAMEVLLNLLFNAVAFSPKDGEILLELHTIGDDGARVRFVVHDQGPGVQADRADAIFEERHSTRPGGVGLGLPHSRKLAQSLGGQLLLVSTGGGACFQLEWPTTHTLSGTRSVAPPASLDGLRIAVLEDDPAVRALLELGLSARGAEVLCIERAEQIDDLSGIHVALVDLSPIAEDPARALARLRSRGEDLRTWLISGCATGIPEVIAKDVLGCIYKPFELAEIVERIAASNTDAQKLTG